MKLHRPLTLSDSTSINELTLDFSSLTTADFRAAQKLRALISDGTAVDASKMMSVLRLDSEFQIAVGWLAAQRGTPGLSQLDFLKLDMRDAVLLGEHASDYFFV